MALGRLCSIEGCDKTVVARGWCEMHYCRWKRYGDPLLLKRTATGEPMRFLREVVLPFGGDDCLRWPFGRISSREGREYAQIWNGDRNVLVSRLVCEAIHGPPPSLEHEAAHSCGKGHKACVTPRHISWKTPSQNQADRVEHDTHDRGERSAWAKLTEADVLFMREHRGRIRQGDLADRFGVGRSNVSMIQSRDRWGWLDTPEAPSKAAN